MHNREMDKKILRQHQNREKRLPNRPAFYPARRNRLPKPLHQLSGPRLFTTDLLELAEVYRACFVWRNGELLSDTAFYGWLFEVRPKGMHPLAVMHYHPSHKPLHLLTPCEEDRDFTNRSLPGVREFNLRTRRYDPRLERDRLDMIAMFCDRCGIDLGSAGGLFS